MKSIKVESNLFGRLSLPMQQNIQDQYIRLVQYRFVRNSDTFKYFITDMLRTCKLMGNEKYEFNKRKQCTIPSAKELHTRHLLTPHGRNVLSRT